jgi:hypothetical protein
MTDFLSQAERGRLEKLRIRDRFIDEALRQLARILASDTFARVQDRTRNFLGFVVSKTLIGDADTIKEMTVAIRVYRETVAFEPLENSKVRVAGLALRRRLTAYYAGEGARDPIEITIPVGTYVPRIRVHVSAPRSRRLGYRSRHRLRIWRRLIVRRI